MTARDMVAAAVMVWLIGAIVGWCAGWAGRSEQNRAWHRGVVRQLAQTQARLAEALDQLDHARATQCEAERVPAAAPAAVHVHVTTPLIWAPPRPMITNTTPFLDAMPVGPAQEVTP